MMKRVFRVAAISLHLSFSLSGPLFAEEMRETERHYEGPPVDGVHRLDPIYPWDDLSAYSEIRRQIKRLETEGVPEEFLILAHSTEKQQSSVRDAEIYTRDNEVLDILFPNDDSTTAREQMRAARYVMFHSALEGNPYALYNLGNSLFNFPDPAMPSDFHLTLWRLAADKEMLPAIVNFIAYNRIGVGELNSDMVEAYLRYGFDMDVPGGGYQVASNLVEFYGYYYKSREDSGYFRRGLDRLNKLGAVSERMAWEAFALLNGEHLTQDVPLALSMLTSLLSERDPSYHHYVSIGYAYANGNGVARDIDLARDIYVACLKASQEAGCALNLGSYFVRPSEGINEPVLAHAFYLLAERLARDQGAREVLRQAQFEQEASKADFPWFGAQSKLDGFMSLIEGGRFSEIEELSDVRAFP